MVQGSNTKKSASLRAAKPKQKRYDTSPRQPELLECCQQTLQRTNIHHMRISPTGITKKGQKTIAPKRKPLIAATALKKACPPYAPGKYRADHRLRVKRVTAQLTAGTERSLAERAGHLELLAGGKKGKKKEEDAGKKT